MTKQKLAWCGIVAPVVFVVALIAFSLLSPSYNNLTNMVSELGIPGSPYAFAWNMIGFTLVGLLVVAFAWSFHTNLRPGLGASIVPSFVAVTGLGFAGLGLFPAEANFQPSLHTTLHFIMVSISFAPFILLTIIFALRLKTDPYWKHWIPFTIIMGIVGLLSFFIPKTIPVGLSQRIGLGSYFIWLFGMGYAILRKQYHVLQKNSRPTPAPSDNVLRH